ncbi:uncharacterized protein LOC128854426 [Cuculus canorus]|uniref:uncharacterized protein LOC128854426 n=1 Tax=Cuculus canorus TaxID=55661 RepID=UPI0023AAC373|nr:uncharacterized protein LOC128854426 [Cuculus canorus]
MREGERGALEAPRLPLSGCCRDGPGSGKSIHSGCSCRLGSHSPELGDKQNVPFSFPRNIHLAMEITLPKTVDQPEQENAPEGQEGPACSIGDQVARALTSLMSRLRNSIFAVKETVLQREQLSKILLVALLLFLAILFGWTWCTSGTRRQTEVPPPTQQLIMRSLATSRIGCPGFSRSSVLPTVVILMCRVMILHDSTGMSKAIRAR